jgi:HAD superfamily phosphatase
MSKPILVFDMDGVLVDVTESYRETICRTVQHFTGREIPRSLIQEYKNQGGWNDDWQLSHELVTRAGVAATFEDVKTYFQAIFHGNGQDGLMLREEWMARPGLLERLAETYCLAVFTGRERWEAELTLKRFAPHLVFSPIIGMHEVPRRKPHPDGLLDILKLATGGKVWYVGDTVDDARCARAAGVPFIGIAAGNQELAALLKAEDAVAVLDDINGLEDALEL